MGPLLQLTSIDSVTVRRMQDDGTYRVTVQAKGLPDWTSTFGGSAPPDVTTMGGRVVLIHSSDPQADSLMAVSYRKGRWQVSEPIYARYGIYITQGREGEVAIEARIPANQVGATGGRHPWKAEPYSLQGGQLVRGRPAPPVIRGVVEDWRRGLQLYGDFPKRRRIDSQGSPVSVPGGVIIASERGVWRLSATGLRRLPGRGDLVGVVANRPVLRQPDGRVAGMKWLPPISWCDSVWQSGTSPTFVVRSAAYGEAWACRQYVGGKLTATFRGIGSPDGQVPVDNGLLLSTSLFAKDWDGDLYYFPAHGSPLSLAHRRRTRYRMSDLGETGRPWVAMCTYRPGQFKVASQSTLYRFIPPGTLAEKFTVPFEFVPTGLDKTQKWLIGVRIRAEHMGNSELIAIRLTDQAIRVLYPGTYQFWPVP